jgi:CHAT domain-containing protein/tetratricopeptide (TPR) repeat protein
VKAARALLRLLLLGGALQAAAVPAFDLPATCRTATPSTTASVPLPLLRKRLEALSESDPTASVQLLCETIPRVEREKGPHSAELAWWAGSLAMPLIAYLDKFQEAIPLLEFAEPILSKDLRHYSNEVADINVAYAWIYFRQGRLADSGKAWEAALKIREHTPGEHQIELQKVLVGLAQVRLSQRDFPAVHVLLDRATDILNANHAVVSEAGAAVENLQTNLAIREEDYSSAQLHAQAQIRVEQQLGGGAPQLVPAYVLLGTIRSRLDDFDGSEAALREAIRLAESDNGPLQRHLMTALNQIATLLYERDRPREALPFAQRALKVGEDSLGADAPKLVAVLRTLAEVHRSLGQLPQALHDYQRAAAIVEHSGTDVERQVLVAHYRGLGSLELELGDLDAARAALSAGLAAAADDVTLTVERAYGLLALAQTADATDPERQQRLEQALALFKARLPASHPVVLRVINELCAIEIATAAAVTPHCQDAAQWLARARDVEPSLRSAVYQNQSALDVLRQDASGAYDQALQALAAAEAVGTPEPLWRADMIVASMLHNRGDRTLAIFFGKQAVGQVERLRAGFIGGDQLLERRFLTDKVSMYRTVADWLMEEGRIDEGLDVLRRLKAQELYDFELRAAAARADAPVDYNDQEERLRALYTAALSASADRGAQIDRLGRLREAGRLTPAEQARLDELLAAEAAGDADRVARLRGFLAGGAGGVVTVSTRVRSIQAAQLATEVRRFGPDTAIAVFVMTPDHLRILVATRRQQLEYHISVDEAVLQRDIGRFLAAISRREDVTAASRALYDLVGRPIDEAAQQTHATRLVLWLDGALRYIPFAALSDGNHFLIDRYALQTYSPAQTSGSTVARAPLRVRGLGVTQASAGFNALPAMADELCDVVRGPINGLALRGADCAGPTLGNGALPGEGFADAAFTEARLRAVLANPIDYSVLHIGSHFSLRPGNTLRSFLVLGDGTRMSLESIRQLNFSGIDLVTLSACQTGLSGAIRDDGREIEGFSTIVQQGGARQVVSSLWEVEDRSTASLMRGLYRSLASNGGDGASALRQAQLALRTAEVGGHRPYDQPFYWAGFVASTR